MLLSIVSLSFALMLAAILLVAASHKLREPRRFARQLDAYGLLPEARVGVVARMLPWGEVVIALALLVPALRPFAGMAAAALLMTYTAAIAFNLWRGRDAIDCGCNGPGVERPLDRALVVRNAVLTSMAIVTALRFGSVSLGIAGVLITVAFALSGLMLYAAIEGLLASRSRLIKSFSGR